MSYTVDYVNLDTDKVEVIEFEHIGIEFNWRYDHLYLHADSYPTHRLANTRENLVRRGATSQPDSIERSPIGTLTFTAPLEANDLGQYPGADTFWHIDPQTIDLTTNGYYVFGQATGTVTGRGYYGGEVGVTGTKTFMWYSYQVAGWAGISPGYPTTVPPAGFPYEGHLDLTFPDTREV